MPVYTYRCGSCGVQFEKHQGFHDAPLKTCPECKKKSLKKVITPTKVIFKGSGFYATDHKSSSGSKSHSHEKSHSGDKPSEKSPPEGKSEKKSESKDESKSD
jgi:putative FmdB family regulatory protein